MDKKVSIVIPIYNHWELVHQLLFDLYTYNRDSIYEIILVDDDSTEDSVYGGARWWKSIYSGMDNSNVIKYVKLEKNVGFLRSSNCGMNQASGDILILISTDVRCPCKFVEDVVRVLSAPKTITGGKLLNFDTGWNKFYGKIYPYIEGWLLACTKEAWDTIGGFDDRFAPCDFEDIDFTTAALSKGYGVIALDNPKIVHLGAQSIGYNLEREKGTNINKIKFEEKWTKA